MKPDLKVCEYKRTVMAVDHWEGMKRKFWKDINHLAAESKANVGK